MKKSQSIIIKIIIFVGTIVIVDFLVGVVMDSIRRNVPVDDEKEAKVEYIINHVNSDVLVIGSSRAACNYDTKVLSDSFPEWSVYNAGLSGASFDMSNIVLNSIIDRYAPKVIIWDFKEDYLKVRSESSYLGLSLLYPYWKESERIRNSLMELQGKNLRLKMLSNCYRYNASSSHLIKAFLRPNTSIHFNYGFDSRGVTDNRNTISPNDFTIPDDTPIDENKIDILNKTFSRLTSQGVECFVVISPMYNDYNEDNVYTRALQKLCDENGVHLIDDSHLKGFIHNNELIYDDYHLNCNGAELFTKELANQIGQTLQGE